jgi:23S rRNA (adenine1618-N6)-methyltransferase
MANRIALSLSTQWHQNIMHAKTARIARNVTQKTRAPILEKLSLHPRNRHRGRYDFAALSQALPALKDFLVANPFDANELTIDFANPAAVMALNAALLKTFYGVESWNVPPGYLCPPIPGRADYVHHAADLLARDRNGNIPRGPDIRVLDIGVGANCIYPLIGHHEYGWRFVGSDTDAVALGAAGQIVNANAGLAAAIELRLQSGKRKIFEGILASDDRFDFVLCNPPFHASARAAEAGAARKWKNLGKAGNPASNPKLNFGGQAAELWCEGGEVGFVSRMVEESAQHRAQVSRFSALVSREENLPAIHTALKAVGAHRVETIAMAQGQKKSRIVAWNFR